MGLRGRLLTLIALALLPAFGLMYVSNQIERSAVRAEAERYALTLSQKEALNQLKTIEEARTALILLAGLQHLAHSQQHCDEFLRDYVDHEPRLANIGVTNPDGKLLCSALPVHLHDFAGNGAHQADLTTAGWQFSLSDRVATASGRRPALVAAYPVMGPNGAVAHVLFAVMPTDWFVAAASQGHLPHGAFFTLLDAADRILASYPRTPRALAEERSVVRRISPHTQAASWVGRTQLQGHDWAVTSSELDTHIDGRGLHVVVAIPMATAMLALQHSLYWNLTALIAFALATLLLAWYGGDLLILRPVRRLAAGAARIASGDYAVSSGIRDGPGEIAVLGRTFDDMARALDTRTREEALQRQRIARLNRIYRILSAINGAIIRIRDRDELLQEACRIVVEQGRFRFAWAGLIEPASDILHVRAHAGEAEDYVRSIRVTMDPDDPEGRGLVGSAIRTGEHQISNDVEHDPRLQPWRQGLLASGIHSAAAFPLRVRGLTIGALALYAAERGFFDDQELTLLDELAADCSLGLEHIEKDQQISFLANWDTLTRLPNRNLFEDRVRQALRHAEQQAATTAIVVVSVANHPAISDRKGRAAGDQTLVEVSARLAALRLGDQAPEGLKDRIARLGNHDFGLIVEGADKDGHVEEIARAIHAALAATVSLERDSTDLDVRVGIALYPEHARHADDLIQHALFAAHMQTQAAPDRRTAFYSAGEDTAAQERFALEAALRTAIERQEFFLEYQPRVDAATGETTSAEALLRWHRPGHGRVPPNEFIGVLEETGLIVPVGEWVTRTAMLQRLAMRDLVPDDFVISVNTSSDELRTIDYVERMRRLLKETGARPEWIEIEITESGLVENGTATLEQLTALKNLGLKLSIDDFGTGYSSLSYLRQFPVDALKIDQAFVREIGHADDALLIVKSVIGLAKALNLTVIAEGVETESQRQILTQTGCDGLQGYLFSRPLGIDALEAWFTETLRPFG